MIILIIGGSGSGKSEFAEQMAETLNHGELIYLATMKPVGEEGRQRVARHRRMRKDKGFATVECATHLERITGSKRQTILLECISNLLANEMFDEEGGREKAGEAVLAEVKRLGAETAHMIIVTNNVFADGMEYDEYTKQYLKEIAAVNEELARWADKVIEVVYGIPLLLKAGGGL